MGVGMDVTSGASFNWNQTSRWGTKQNVHVTISTDKKIEVSVIEVNLIQRLCNKIAARLELPQWETKKKYSYSPKQTENLGQIKGFISKLPADDPRRKEIEASMDTKAGKVVEATAFWIDAVNTFLGRDSGKAESVQPQTNFSISQDNKPSEKFLADTQAQDALLTDLKALLRISEEPSSPVKSEKSSQETPQQVTTYSLDEFENLPQQETKPAEIPKTEVVPQTAEKVVLVKDEFENFDSIERLKNLVNELSKKSVPHDQSQWEQLFQAISDCRLDQATGLENALNEILEKLNRQQI